MLAPNCPDHGRLALDLALGRLDDDGAARAEEIVDTCPVCRDWWQTRLGGSEAAGLDRAVAEVFDDLRLPARRRGHGWMAVAAAVVVTLGASVLWLARDTGPVLTEPVEVAAIRSLDFESGELEPVATTTSADLEEQQVAARPAFSPAPVRAEEVRVVEAAQISAEIEPAPLFAGGFESGDLSGWGSGT